MIKAIIYFILFSILASCQAQKQNIEFYRANHDYINIVGRVDFSNHEALRCWNPGVYLQFRYYGDSCEIIIKDELPWGNSHNYITLVIDNEKGQRIKLIDETNHIVIGKNLGIGAHEVTLCKSTESGIGYVEFIGLKCKELLEPKPLPFRKIEFIGNSITCGTGSDNSIISCDSLEWHDKHNAFMSYGPLTARSLDAQWILTSVSGIGMVHSCCNLGITMPEVYNKVNLQANQIEWDFSKYQPDVLTIALGQNDGIQDSTLFCSTYVEFIQTLRGKYPHTTIVCLNSPMEDESLGVVLKKYILAIENHLNNNGDENVCSFFFSRSYNSGCDYHPNLEEHALIAKELEAFIRVKMNW
jgi:lysophospholipase L1-like esterase